MAKKNQIFNLFRATKASKVIVLHSTLKRLSVIRLQFANDLGVKKALKAA